jgi:hydrogenase maturation protein HypF
MQVRKEIRVSLLLAVDPWLAYVLRLASEQQLAGSVRETPGGVTIEVEGSAESVDRFVARLPVEAPVPGSVARIDVRELPVSGEGGFHMAATGALSPDLATMCGGCRRRLCDSDDPRHGMPTRVLLDENLPPILGLGGERQNTVCLARGNQAFLSQQIDDLENPVSQACFRQTVENLERVLSIKPGIIAFGLHPASFPVRWALEQNGVRRIGVQHHHAHIAACMAENRLHDKVIGFALDGGGYGTDGRLWGGEALLADRSGFERAAHLAYVPMPGGAAAVREPWRMAVAYLARDFGRAFLDSRIPLFDEVGAAGITGLLNRMDREADSPLTSSCGRLFDAVAALVGLRQHLNSETQEAIGLEKLALDSRDEKAYPMGLVAEGAGWVIDTRPLFEALLADIERKVPVGTLSRRFHNGLVVVLSRLAQLVRVHSGIRQVCLSGDVFENVFLFERLRRALESDGFEVFSHVKVPAGDGGLSLGQTVIAARR